MIRRSHGHPHPFLGGRDIKTAPAGKSCGNIMKMVLPDSQFGTGQFCKSLQDRQKSRIKLNITGTFTPLVRIEETIVPD